METVNHPENPNAAALTALWDEAMTGNLLAQRAYFVNLSVAVYREASLHLHHVKARLRNRRGGFS